jgi:Putative Actinobacterial Holin-X, holin superfamily III
MTSSADGATADLLRALTDDLTTLIRSELKRVQEEVTDKARQAGRGGALLAGAGVLGTLSAGTSAVFVVRLLDRFLPPRASAFVATALYGGGAAALAVAGWNEIRRSLASAPGDVLADVRQDVQAVRDGASGEQPVAGTDPDAPGV